MKLNILILLFSFFVPFVTHSSDNNHLYWLCGPDEDGCPEDGYEFCVCIPQNGEYAEKPYCLDFNKLSCQPLINQPDCDPHFIFNNQNACLATIYHSMPNIPCILTTDDFCHQHHTRFCADDGTPDSCQSDL